MAASRAEITFEVPGWPPTKNEATSMLAAGHSPAPRVRALLEAARSAAQRTGGHRLSAKSPSRSLFEDLDDHHLTRRTSSAIGDVLQDKTVGRSPDLTHLGELGGFSLYTDDRQIRQIHYTEERAAQPSYSVWIRQVDPAVPVATASAAAEAFAQETATERGHRRRRRDWHTM